MVPQPTHKAREWAIVALAVRQHGVITAAQLESLGLSASGVRKRAGKGRLHRVHPGVYTLVPIELLSREARWLAATSTCGAGTVVSHATAASLHELRRSQSARIEVTVPSRSRRRRCGLRVHRSLTLSPADVTTVSGVPCTTVARTLLDLAARLSRRALERTLDQAEILGVLDLAALQDQLARNPRHRGARRLSGVLEEHWAGSTPTWSELEERFLAVVSRARLPMPEVNAFIDPGDGEPPMRVDFYWPAQRVVVEADGRATHGTAQAFEQDRRRDQRLLLAGLRPLRTTWRQLTRAPAELERTLVALVAPYASPSQVSRSSYRRAGSCRT